MKNPNHKTPHYGLRRTGAAALLTLTALGGWKAAELGEAAKNGIESNVEQASEAGQFDQPFAETENRFDKSAVIEGLKKAKVSPEDVTISSVGPDVATPTDLAKQLGAKDVRLVAQEISGQVGGERDMEPGEIVAIPTNQLEAKR